jgi:hypothetical protein
VGRRPKFGPGHFCFPYNGEEWYVSSYSKPNQPVNEYHPFGCSFQVSPWECKERIDHYEPRPYKRVDMEVAWSEESHPNDPGVDAESSQQKST